MQGIDLSRRFYSDMVAPWLDDNAPGLLHAAGLIDAGSELLGFDDDVSRDHDWGPRVQIILAPEDFAAHARGLVQAFAHDAPEAFLGEPVAWRSRVRAPVSGPGSASSAGHGLEIHTLASVLERHFALHSLDDIPLKSWLGFAEQRLLAFTAGPIFRDDSGRLSQARERLAFFPHDIWLYKLACQWRRIAEEQAFVGRAGQVGDDLGSRVIAARLVRDVMRMAFLLERRYAPYSKWLGSAFTRLPLAKSLAPWLDRTLRAEDWVPRGEALAEAYAILAEMQNGLGIARFACRIGPYHERPFVTIDADAAITALQAQIADPDIKGMPIMGALDQVSDLTPLLEDPKLSRKIMSCLTAPEPITVP